MISGAMIAVIGWGSLIWCPGALAIASCWRADGPRLPIEFARISKDQRLTLVIVPDAAPVQTYWARSAGGSLESCVQNLKLREGGERTPIAWVRRSGRIEVHNSSAEIVRGVEAWLASQPELDAAVWTDLASNWKTSLRRREFSVDDAVDYALGLERGDSETLRRAREYVCNAPPQTQTAVRARLRERGWQDAVLPSVLFE